MGKPDNIDDLISKYLSGNALPEDVMLLEDWRNEHPDNELYFSDFHSVFHALRNNSGKKEINSINAWKKINDAIKVKSSKSLKLNTYHYLGIAASLLLLICIGALANYYLSNRNTQEIVYKTTQETQQITLKDGTGILVSENSKVIVNKNFGTKNRTIHLKGQASFHVIHDNKLPFIVDVDGFFIEDLGTRFNIRSSLNDDSVFVNVKEGVVLLFNNDRAALKLKAPEKAFYIRSKKQIVKIPEIKALTNQLIFNSTKLSDVVLKLNSIYKTTIIIENTQLNNCTITTNFKEEDLEKTLRIITETLGLSFEKTRNGYLIKGQECQP